MKPILSIAIALFATGSSVSAPPAVELSYEPAPGAEVRRTIRSKGDFALDELSSVVNGQEVPPEFLPDMDLRFGWELDLVVEDRIEEANGGRPTVLHRTFVRARNVETQEMRIPPAVDESLERRGRSPLESRTVVFTRDERSEEYTATFADGEEGPVLDGLTEDLDLRALLPDGEVEEGDVWTVDADFLDVLLTPGGNLPLDWTGDDLEEPAGEETAREGELELTFLGWDPAAEGRIARVRVKGEYLREEVAPTDLDDVPIADGTATNEISAAYEVEGELRWDVKAGLARGLDLVIDMALTLDTIRDPDQPGVDFTSTLLVSGEWTFRMDVERVD